ncbi:MAG: esterase-like activity of phytase family protein [Prevotella sp.]|nr:esterase-like activity of phytase family protein [Prevotella sp.]
MRKVIVGLLLLMLPLAGYGQTVVEMGIDQLLNLVTAVADTLISDGVDAAAEVLAQPAAAAGTDSLSVVEHRQQSFPLSVPAGNYSGIAYLGGGRYAVVNDKSDTDGFHLFAIDVDTLSGELMNVRHEGFVSSGQPNRDGEGIAYVPLTHSLFISGERDNEVLEYTMEGQLTGRRLAVPAEFKTAKRNYGLESLTYNAQTHRFWTTSESTLPADGQQATTALRVRNRLRLQSFDDNLQPAAQYFYEMDEPSVSKSASTYALGVSELCAMDDGRLIVMEREFYVPSGKLGSFVVNKLYLVNPDTAAAGAAVDKQLLLRFRTTLALFSYGLANYEGMCLGPRLADGRQVLVLISDSQNQYKGVLKDWFKTVVIQ